MPSIEPDEVSGHLRLIRGSFEHLALGEPLIMPANSESLSKIANHISKNLKMMPGPKRSPKAKLVFHEISPEDCAKALAEYDARPRHKRSALSQRLELLEPGSGFSIATASLPSIKSSVSKFAKTDGRTYRVFPGGADGEVIVLRTG
jgi:hypothetical protein